MDAQSAAAKLILSDRNTNIKFVSSIKANEILGDIICDNDVYLQDYVINENKNITCPTLTVTKLGSRNANLKSLVVEGYDINFDSNTTSLIPILTNSFTNLTLLSSKNLTLALLVIFK